MIFSTMEIFFKYKSKKKSLTLQYIKYWIEMWMFKGNWSQATDMIFSGSTQSMVTVRMQLPL